MWQPCSGSRVKDILPVHVWLLYLKWSEGTDSFLPAKGTAHSTGETNLGWPFILSFREMVHQTGSTLWAVSRAASMAARKTSDSFAEWSTLSVVKNCMGNQSGKITALR